MWKGLYFGAILTICAISSEGQGIGAEAGFTMNSMSARIPGINTDNLLKPGFMGGIVLDHYVNSKISYQYGVFYNAKGGFISYDTHYIHKNGSTVKQNFDGYLRVDYIELPVSLLYRSPYKNGGHFFAGGGIYMATAFGGILSYERYETVLNQSQSEMSALLPLSVGYSSSDEIRTFDAGLQGQVGYELGSGFYTRIHAGYGVLNVSPSPSIGLRNINFGMSVGYMLR